MRASTPFPHKLRAVGLAALLTCVSTPPTAAQLVTPRTVPVMQDEQFEIYPSSRPGLAGISIALDDTLADPFTNPAKATRLNGFTLSTAPYTHSISGNRGGGRTLPIGFFARSGSWAAAAVGAMQQLDRAGPTWNRPTSELTATNQYLSGSIAHRFEDHNVSVGVSATHADLAAVDGVDLLYAGSDRIDQSGSFNDYRLGATREWEPGHVLELMVLRNTTDMRHDVHFNTGVYNPTLRTFVSTARTDVNLDQTNIWGVHSEYVQPVGVEGWHVGILGTANHLSHPKIPNYVLQNLPRDPGTTNAFNVGLGAARETGSFTLGADVIIEPMTSNTWADAATITTRPDGTTIPAGDKTVENHFQFHNTKARLGVGHTWGADTSEHGAFTLNFGLSMYAISYDLTQTNNITRTQRTQHENWVESGPTVGMRFRTHDIELSYAFRANCGDQGCDAFRGGDIVFATQAAPTAGGIIAAPSAPLRLQEGGETSHHFTISVPIR
ncbi:hypothetical protein BH11GEM2_BH11GEM2_29110 [soil metagenome]